MKSRAGASQGHGIDSDAQMSDAELLTAWRDGDGEAGRALLAGNFDLLCRFFNNKVDDEVQDLIQRTMLVCLQNFDRLREASNFRAYLLAIARNELYRHLSRTRAEGQRIDFGVSSIHDLSPSPSRVVAEHRDGQLLLEALRQLPLDEQVALELFYWEDLSYPEIAEIVDVHRDTVKRRLQRARSRLREKLAHLGELPEERVDEIAQALRSTTTR
jgi:RNA polymerase sigma factor (sigma-70 family)